MSRSFFGVCLIWFTSAVASVAQCRDDQVEIKGDWGSARFSVEVADTDESRALGLMNRSKLPFSAGMLFVYDTPQTMSFWMENTLIPLDMLFIGPDGTIQKIHENAVPLDRTHIPSGPGIQFVLEINGGLASRMQIDHGSIVRHPAIDPDLARWPCAKSDKG